MTAESSASLPDFSSAAGFPDAAEIISRVPRGDIDALSKALEIAFTEKGLRLKAFKEVKSARTERWFKVRMPLPYLGSNESMDCVVVAATGPWTEERTDTYIASFAPLRLVPGLSHFLFYSEHPIPAELSFLFGTPDSGVFEIAAWDKVERESPDADDLPALSEAGRALIFEVYGLDLEADDLQWVSVANQLIDEEFRWFTDDPDARLEDEVDYVPYASLLLLAAVAGEAIRLNHPELLMWADADGDNWPKIAMRGKTTTLPVIDTLFRRFEGGGSQDIWEMYKMFYTVQQLPPPTSFDAVVVDPLEFLPSWDPEPGRSLLESIETFEAICAKEGLSVTPHPASPSGESARILTPFMTAYTCVRDEQRYDLFVCSDAWTSERERAFIKTYGHRSLADWEIGAQPVFVFFSGNPLPALLEYCFIDGPPAAPLEGLARVETPSPDVSPVSAIIHPLAHWLLHALELYTTIGLDLDSSSILPGLEFFLREELSQQSGAQAPAEQSTSADIEYDVYDMDHYGSYIPMGLLVTVGLTAGEAIRSADPDGKDWTSVEGVDWPVLAFDNPETGARETFDWVGRARAIWEGKAEEFGW